MPLYNAKLVSRTTEDVQKKDGSGTYKAVVVKYETNGEVKEKKLVFSFVQKNNPALLEKLKLVNPGEDIVVKLEGEFYNLADILKPSEVDQSEIAKPKPKGSFFPSKGAGGRADDPARQASIIRQSCLKASVELVCSDKTDKLSEVERVTKLLETFVKSVGSLETGVATEAEKTKDLPKIEREEFNDNVPF